MEIDYVKDFEGKELQKLQKSDEEMYKKVMKFYDFYHECDGLGGKAWKAQIDQLINLMFGDPDYISENATVKQKQLIKRCARAIR